jgi:hypothetical protein
MFEQGSKIAVAALLLVASRDCGQQPQCPPSAALATKPSPIPGDSPPSTSEKPRTRGYSNGVNRLVERRLVVKDDRGKPAVRDWRGRPIGDVDLRIVWTQPTQYDWNYCLPELHGGKDLFHTVYPSGAWFLERRLGAKTIVAVSVPDTPYAFYIINGRVSTFFLDSKKGVIWELWGEALAEEARGMTSVATSSKRIQFSAAGGDMAAFLVVDFADRENAPAVSFHVRYDGP